jgi:molecular chaperone HtpG
VTREQRGTTVQLKLKADAEEFLRPERLTALIRKYSDHIAFPVRLVAGAEHEETVNRAKALWTRPRGDIKDEEYVEFYKHIAHDSEEPLTWSHNRVEGKREYTSLLYVPAAAPFDLWNRESAKGVKLYVQRVFITDQATQFLPLYLRFVRGVVDSSELALNVSRELLQQDEAVAAMRSALTRRVLDMLERLAEDAGKYAKLWAAFGALLKEGLVEDSTNRDRLAKLVRFATTKTAGTEELRSLEDYVRDAKAEQDAIYYLVAESSTTARSSPHLEAFNERGIEVLLLADRLDEWVMQHLTEYGGKPLKDVRRGALDLAAPAGPETKVKAEDRERQALLKRVKQVLRERVDEVRVGGRLRQSAACLVLSEHDLGYQMRELLAAAGHKPPAAIPSLELNPEHSLVRRLDAESDPKRFERLALLLFEQAVLAEGRPLEDPAAFVARLNELLSELGEQGGS